MNNSEHEVYMRRCLELAERGLRLVAPNPMVGAVIVKDGVVVGEGAHLRFGAAHAEVEAIRSVKDSAQLKGSTLYVNLEPCCHIGKTPPCTQAIIEAGIKNVLIGCKDPDKRVSGGGIEVLRKSGITVTEGVLEQEARYLNRRFIVFHTKRRPYVILKWARTKDGLFARADGTSRWITSMESRTLTHKWRGEECATMVGPNTVIIDNPSLTVRHVKGENPIRMIVDRTLRVSGDFNVFSPDAKTIVWNAEKEELHGNVHYCRINPFTMKGILDKCREMGILSLILEGGASLIRHFINEDLWDEARIFTGDVEFGEGLAAPSIIGDYSSKETKVGPDLLKTVMRGESKANQNRNHV